MSNSIVSKVLTTLDHKIMKVASKKYELGLVSKETDFSRKPRKLSFEDDLKIIISMGPSSIKEEMYKYFSYNINTVSVAGFVESRTKVKEEAFKCLLDEINKAYPCNITYKGYRLLAVDGSDITIPTDKNDHESFESRNKTTGFNNYHLNGLYDILNHRYLDTIIQPLRKENEIKAMWTMTDRYKGDKAIFIADRNYATLNIFEHIRHTNNYFLIRVKDINSKTSLLSRFKSLLKTDEFDEDVSIILTNKQTNEIREHPEKYKMIMSNQTFDYLDKDNHFYNASYRILRIRIDGKDEEYESIITNLPKEEFSSSDIKELYKLRWNIEISYKHLKYSVNLNALHSKRRDFIRQEILARIVMFNISMIIINDIQKNKIKKKERKYEYRICISKAIHLIRAVITKRKGGVPPNLTLLIAKEILPIRPGRKSKRNVKPHSYVSFNYRFC